MKNISIIFMLLTVICVFLPLPSVLAFENNNTALIYNGVFADDEGAEAMSDLADEFGLTTVWFNEPKMLLDLLSDSKLVIIGGTIDDINPFVELFTPDIRLALKNFVNQGGLYLGICGGGYIASSGWEENDGFVEAIELVPYESDSFSIDTEPQIIHIKWNNVKRPVYYQFGPKFLLPEHGLETIIARYDDNSVAAFSMIRGSGKIVLVGPHPEADETWIEYSVKNAGAWTPTHDMARDMMQEVLK